MWVGAVREPPRDARRQSRFFTHRDLCSGEDVVSHHDRFDDRGYPRGLEGEEIPLLGRILAVADAYSAMTTDRPYRKALTPEAAAAELKANAGSQFDPAIVDVFLCTLRRKQSPGLCAIIPEA